MDQRISASRIPSGNSDDRRISEKIFIFVGMTIVLGGVWMLYMGNAPYHPDAEALDMTIQITVDS